MKMRKLLASGVAASLAVTSLASFASAEEKIFDMGTPDAGYNATAKLGGDLNKTVGKSVTQKTMQKVTLEVGDADENANKYAGPAPILKVTGTKGEGDEKERITKEYSFTYDSDSRPNSISIVVLDDTQEVYRAGEFAPNYFDTIETMTLEFPVSGSTTDKDTYNGWKNKKDGYKTFDVGNAIVADWDGKVASNAKTYKAEINTIKGYLAAEEDNNKAAAIIAYAFTNGGWKASTAEFVDPEVDKATYLNKKYPRIEVTDGDGYDWNTGSYTNRDKTLVRNEIDLLSLADHYLAESGGTAGNKDGANQSYDDDGEGTIPYQFAGLASQVADFFNKQTNGTITFKFKADSSSSADDWFVGGVPSTQVGIKNFMEDVTANDFALFFNYTQTGSLQAMTSVDKEAGTVTFDISEVLDALGGQTVGVIDNIYYGLTKGIKYDSWTNQEYLEVETITLAYDEDADADLDVEDDTADDDAEEDDDVEDDTADDDADEDDDASIDEDDDDADEDDDADADDADDDDKDVAGDVVTGGEDDDTNPATGVALAVVPALVAAAAAVVSKKRK